MVTFWLYTHWNLFVSLAVISSLFLCIPDNSMTLCLFHQLSLHSDSETTDNMSHIQPYCPGTQASGMYSILGWWQLFGSLPPIRCLFFEFSFKTLSPILRVVFVLCFLSYCCFCLSWAWAMLCAALARYSSWRLMSALVLSSISSNFLLLFSLFSG